MEPARIEFALSLTASCKEGTQANQAGTFDEVCEFRNHTYREQKIKNKLICDCKNNEIEVFPQMQWEIDDWPDWCVVWVYNLNNIASQSRKRSTRKKFTSLQDIYHVLKQST